MFTDSHCHLNFPELQERLPQILQDMKDAQVTRALCISTTLEDFPQVHQLALDYPHMWATVGVHPDNEGVQEPTFDDLVSRSQLPRVVGIGETGLDYYQMDERKGGRTIADMEWQRERFRIHIRAAIAADKPLIIHTRSAAEDTLRIMREEGAEKIGGVMHCFTESLEVAEQAIKMGFYISFSGIVTFKNATALKEVAKHVPLDRILVETDSPYLAPVPYRGKTNQPAYVKYVAQEIAKLRGISEQEVASATTENFFRLFKHAQKCS